MIERFDIAGYARISVDDEQDQKNISIENQKAIIEDYVKTLSFAEIAARIARDQGYDPKTHPLTPVTTRNFETFVLESGAAAKKEYSSLKYRFP